MSYSSRNRKCPHLLLWFFVASLYAYAQQAANGSLRGVVTDPSTASAPGALVQVRSSSHEYRAYTGENGRYSIIGIAPGRYLVRVIAKGFSVTQRADFEITGAVSLDVQLTLKKESQIVNVESEADRVSTDPTANGGAVVLGQKELAVLSDDPDELEQQLQAMAGPGAGPSGGQIYVDGFTGSSLPPKSSIREVRINSNPFSPEYDRPGFGRIEIFTRPGSDIFRGQAFFQFNNQDLNSRSPLLAQATRPSYDQKFFGLDVSGPVVKRKASFSFSFERRNINDNAFILATTVGDNYTTQAVNQTIVTPQTRTNFSPRVDYAINERNTLVLRYQHTRTEFENEGVGDFNLSSQAYNKTTGEDTVQLTHTFVISPTAINESRFQYMRGSSANDSQNSAPEISVQGAFTSGGAQVGNSGSLSNRWELSNQTTLTRGAHTLKFGLRARQVFLDDASVNNFYGTYTFFGGVGPAFDASDNPIAGTSIQLTALERYRRTLLLGSRGLSAAQIRLLGGGASQLGLSAGTAVTRVRQLDLGFYASDDWRLRPNLTLSYGLRYEAQTNAGDLANFGPRVGLAWAIDGGSRKQGRTVLRTGFGAFYDRIDESTILQADRYNGVTQQSYLLLNPDTYPVIPSLTSLSAGKQPQQLQILDAHLRNPVNYQWNLGLDRQINRYVRLSANYIGSRGVHVKRSRNINTPIGGVYPFGDSQLRNLNESTGFSRSNMLILSPMVNYKKVFLFGFYGLSYGKTDVDGQPANPYNLRAEWGPSAFSDVRHRFILGTGLPMPWKLSLSPFAIISSGTPYNITTGRDALNSGFATQRPSLVSTSAAGCVGASLVYESGRGCFDLNPVPGTEIERNSARGPANVSLNLRLARTWSFGRRGESGSADQSGPPPGMGGIRGGGGPPAGGPPGAGPGGPGGLFGAASAKKYNLTLSVSARNILNHANYSPPSGDLSSPYFGEYRSLAGFGPMSTGSSTYNRKLDIQLRFQF